MQGQTKNFKQNPTTRQTNCQSPRNVKSNFTEEILKQAKKVAAQTDMITLYHITKKFRRIRETHP